MPFKWSGEMSELIQQQADIGWKLKLVFGLDFEISVDFAAGKVLWCDLDSDMCVSGFSIDDDGNVFVEPVPILEISVEVDFAAGKMLWRDLDDNMCVSAFSIDNDGNVFIEPVPMYVFNPV